MGVQFGDSEDDRVNKISLNESDDVFIAGYSVTTSGRIRDFDALLTKIDGHTGDLVWSRLIRTDEFDAAYDVATDGSGSVYMAGETRGDISGNAFGQQDAFLSKHDGSGNQQWTRQLGTTEFDVGTGVASDHLGNVFIAGYTRGSLGGTNGGGFDAFVAKFSTDGNRLWLRQFGTDENDSVFAIDSDDLGNVYVAGKTFGDLGGLHAGGGDVFLTKLDSDGNEVWSSQFGSGFDDQPTSISINRATGDIVMSGGTAGNLTDNFRVDTRDAFIAKLDESGSVVWINQLFDPLSETAQGVDVDSVGNVFAVGHQSAPAGGPQLNEAILIALSSDGRTIWRRTFGTENIDLAFAVAVDEFDALNVAGTTDGDLFGPNSRRGSDDIFVFELQIVPEPSSSCLSFFLLLLSANSGRRHRRW